MLGAAFPEHVILFILVPVILAGVYPLIYSYQEYQWEIKARVNILDFYEHDHRQ